MSSFLLLLLFMSLSSKPLVLAWQRGRNPSPSRLNIMLATTTTTALQNSHRQLWRGEDVVRNGIIQLLSVIRGGAIEDEEDSESEDESEDEYDDESEEEEEEEEEEEDEDEEVEVSEVEVQISASSPSSLSKAVEKKTKKKKKTTTELAYDEPLLPSPMLNLYVSLGVMFLAKRVDLFNPTIVRVARFAFIAYLVILQAFVFYVRIQAKLTNDQTVITLQNPLSSVLQSQLSSGGMMGETANGMVKNLASSFLSSSCTILEYDIKQANSMQSGLIFNMAMMWFMHFKMEQVQPLIIQSITGMLNMVYSPLFQVYVLHRNLQRPFVTTPKAKTTPEEQPAAETEGDSTASAAEIAPSQKGVVEASTGKDDEEKEEEEEEEEEGDSDGDDDESDDADVKSGGDADASVNDDADADDSKEVDDITEPTLSEPGIDAVKVHQKESAASTVNGRKAAKSKAHTTKTPASSNPETVEVESSKDDVKKATTAATATIASDASSGEESSEDEASDEEETK